MLDYENYPIIAAIRSENDLSAALNSNVQTIFMLNSNIMSIENITEKVHKVGKLIYFHMDFVDGLSKDSAGVRYLATKNIDGIISTRNNIISSAKEYGISCVQRCFMIDSRSVDTAIESVKQSHADMLEIMPALAYKSISKIKKNLRIPIIAGGLIEKKDEIYSALSAGASMVSTGAADLWNE